MQGRVASSYVMVERHDVLHGCRRIHPVGQGHAKESLHRGSKDSLRVSKL